MVQETKEIRAQTPEQSREQQSTAKGSAKATSALAVIKVLSREEFRLSPYYYGTSSVKESTYYLVVENGNGAQDAADDLNNLCMPLLSEASDSAKKSVIAISTPKGALSFKVSAKGNIELLSVPLDLNLTINTPGIVGHEGHYKSAALTVTAQSLMNKGELFIDDLRLHCNIVNRGKIVARNATLKRTPGDAETLTLDNTEGIIDIQKRLVWQQGRIKNTRGKFCSETLRGNTTGALNNQHGWIQVRKRARLNLRGGLQNSHGAIVQHLGETDNVKPDSTGIWIKTRENIRCTDGGAISAYQGIVDIRPAIPVSKLEGAEKLIVNDSTRIGSRVEATQKKIIVDDSSRVGGTTGTNIVGFNQVRFSTPATGNVININSDRVQLERGVLTEGSAVITPALGKFRFEDIWKAGKTTLNLLEGETITQPYTALGSLSYRLAPFATQPLVFLANQTSLQGDFTVEAPVPVKLGDATHVVTIKTEYGNFSVKAPIFDIEQGGVVAVKSFIETLGGSTLGRLIEDPNRKVFATIYEHGNLGNNIEPLKFSFLNQEFVGENVKIYDNRHLIVMPVAISNGSFFSIRESMEIIGPFHNRGNLNVLGVDKEGKALGMGGLSIDSTAGESIWEVGIATIRGNCALIGKFTLKRVTSTYNFKYHNSSGTHSDCSYHFCNSDAAQLNVQGILSGSATINNEANLIHAVDKSAEVHINDTIVTSGIPQRFVSGDQHKLEQLKNAVVTDRWRISRTVVGWGGKLHWGGRQGPGCGCSKYNGDSKLFIPYALGFSDAINSLEAAGQAEKATTVFRGQVSCVNDAVFPEVQHFEGFCSARTILFSLGAGHAVIGSRNPYIPPQNPSPVCDLMKDSFNPHVTYVEQNLKATFAQEPTDKFHFMIRELFWFDDAHAQAFYRDITEHLFVVSPEGIKRADPRAVLSLSPKLLIERVQKATQKALMRGYINEGEVIDERLVQQMHRNATEYLESMDKQTLKDFLSGKIPLKTAPSKPLIYYEPIVNEQNVEVLQPYTYIPLALVKAVHAQFRSSLFLAFSNKFAPKQLIDLTQHNPAMQSQVIKFFDEHPDKQKFLADHAAAAVATALALENKMNAEQRAMLESKHDAEHPVSVPEHALALRDNQAHQSSVTFMSNFDVGFFAALVDGAVSIDAADIKAREAFIASLFSNVEFKARVERLGNSENFSDRLERARIAVDGILQILAGKDVIFEAAHTQSGLGTHIEALGNILDMPVQLVRQQVQHFHERKCSGRITDEYTIEAPSIHQTNANYEALAGGVATVYGTQYEAENVMLSAVENTNILPVANSRQQTCDMTRKKGGFFGSGGVETTHSASVQETAVPVQFNVRKNVTIISGKEVHCFTDSTALENHFWGEIVHIMQGVNQSCSVRQTSSRGIFWQKFCSEMTREVTYRESNFSGSIKIHAKQAILDQVRGKTLGFWEQLECNDAAVTYQILDPQYVHDEKRIQGPSQGLVIVVPLAAGVATFGIGEVVAGSAFVTGIVGTGATMGVAVAAGFSALCGQAAVSLLQNEGNPLKAVESLASVDTAKSVAMAMISAGVMKEICDALKLPGLGEKKSLVEHLQYNVARASVNVALNMSINRQSPGDALKAGLTDAAVGTAAGAVAQKIGGLRQEGRIGYASHKLLHAALGAVGGAILAGPKGALAGAIGAAVAEIGAEVCAPEERKNNSEAEQTRYKEELSRAAQIGVTTGAAAALLVCPDHVPIAATMGGNSTANNFLTSNGLSKRSGFEGSDADAREPKDEPKNEVDDSQFMRELARERTAESLTFQLDSRRDDRMPRNGWERLADDRGSFCQTNTPNEVLSKAELTPYTAPWFKRFAMALLGDNSPATQRWQTSNQKLMAKEKVFIDDFTSRQHERFSTPSLLPASHQNPYVEGGLRTCRAVGRAMDNIGDGLLHLDRMAIDTGVFMWDASGAAAKVTFGACTEGSQLRNDARIKTVTHEFNRFVKADISQMLDMITEVGATFAIGGGLTRLPGNLTRNAVLPKPSPVRRIETTLRPVTESKNLSEGMFTLYHSSKRTQASLATRAEAFSEVTLVLTSLQRSRISAGSAGNSFAGSSNFRVINSSQTIVAPRNQKFGQSAWQSFRSNPQKQIRITGGRTVKEEMVREKLAVKLYDEIRCRPDDISKIAENLDLPRFQIQRVKDHLFYNTHQLDHGLGVGRFHPDLDIANAWRRLEAGTHTEADLLIFRHEHFEARFEGIFKTDYRTAHDAASINHPSGLKNTEGVKFSRGSKNGIINRHQKR